MSMGASGGVCISRAGQAADYRPNARLMRRGSLIGNAPLRHAPVDVQHERHLQP